jgi:hypothetical protein
MIGARDFGVSAIHIAGIATIDLAWAATHVSTRAFRSNHSLHVLHLIVE